jgi:hypothetical protein
MISKIKEIAKATRLYDFIRSHKQKEILKKWEIDTQRKGPLPHILKQFTVKDYAYKYRCGILVETGTYEGEMVKACLPSFNKIYSIELDKTLFEKAVNRFKNNSNVKILNGDSGVKLSEVLREVNSRCVFWLDGHYSAGITAKGELDTPIAKEIESIFNHSIQDHVILIDDARCFDGTNDYPQRDKFIEELYNRKQNIKVEVYNDIIRITQDNPVVQ